MDAKRSQWLVGLAINKFPALAWEPWFEFCRPNDNSSPSIQAQLW